MRIVFPDLTRATRTLLFALLALTTGLPAYAAYTVPVPSQLDLTVRETAGVARSGEVLRSGIPIPRSLNLRSTASLAVVDAAGKAVPAEFRVTARWNAPLTDAAAPIQWLLVTFPATVSARGSVTYRVVINGSVANPAPTRPLRLTQTGDLVTVDTGAAVFRFGTDPGALFEEILLDNGTRVVGGSDMTIRSSGGAAGHSTTRKIRIEHAGPLSAVVVVHGAYDLAPVGNGQMGSVRRYVFTAGSPTAVVRHVVQWEGNLACNGCTKTTSGAPNGVRVEQIRDTLAVSLGGTPTVTAVGDFDAAAVAKAVGAGQTAEVRQLLRTNRTAPLSFRVNVGGTAASGAQADGGMLAASGPSGAVAIGLSRMHRYEPQALRLLSDGSLAVDVADGSVWLAHHQGLFAELAVSAMAPNPSRSQLDRVVWAPLNRPLRAWPTAAWFAASDAVDEVPVGNLPAAVASYDTVVPSVLDRTLRQTDLHGIAGLTTFGVFPRYWGKDGAPGELDCGGGDPTPGEAWDDKFWCATWADYHNTSSTAPIWAMRSGQVEWLDEISTPAALRMLHTVVMRCGPDEKWFYCGQAPAGYGGYRIDFNSSHAYFENLILHYWLTGDSTVVETLRRGGENMRRMQCDTRGPRPVVEPLLGPAGPACDADRISTTSEFTGRVPSQWITAFRFLGLASEDGTFLEDFRSSLSRAVTQHYVEAKRNGVSYGFLGERAITAGTYIDGPMWMHGFYDTNNLYRLLRDTKDAPTGNPALAPSRVMTAIARTLKDIEPTVQGDGTVDGDWPKNIQYTYAGARVGGTLVATVPNDRPIYTPEKTSVTALFLRTAEMSNDAALRARGEEMVQIALAAAAGEGAPLGKLQGQYLTRLHAAVARLTNLGGSTPTPPPPPPPPPPGTAPTAPGSLQAQAVSGTAIQLAWSDKSANEDSFRVEQKVGGVFQEVQATAANATGAQITGLQGGTAYTFRVRARNTYGNSAYSNQSTATTSTASASLPAPSALVATAASSGEIRLTWTDNSSNEESFLIEKISNGEFKQFKMTGSNITSVKLLGLAAGTEYTFRVRAATAGGYSAYSNTATVTTSGSASTVLAGPTSLIAKAVSATEVELTWRDNSKGETQFRIEKLVGGKFREVRQVGANQTRVRVSGLAAKGTYSFRVRATSGNASSPYSNVAKVKTKS
ncbi:MAG TPA: fibronectin type III domain-containing protein [Thermoanaerobaculia bacterium]|nr:fibronectin type III domain-containing protein [Thermoanaerobaculia bacterium]